MKAKVNDRFSYELDFSAEFSASDLGDNRYDVVHQDNRYMIEVLETDFRKGSMKLAMNGFVFHVLLEDDLARTIRLIRQRSAVHSGEYKVIAPIPGVIKRICQKNGSDVKDGEDLLVLEAMKMENAIQAPMNAAKVKYQVKPGDRVSKGQILCILIQ